MESILPDNHLALCGVSRATRILIILILAVTCSGVAADRSPPFEKGGPGGISAPADDRPNIIIIFTDDQGYADLGAYGAKGFATPNIDRLAAEGMRFTSFYVPANVCTPSRAALLTGRYPMRVGLPNVLFPRSTIGLNPQETTIAEMLSDAGYATAAIGKWHLGAHPLFLPTNHGFDEFFGLPYSNDMSPEPHNNPNQIARNFPPLPLLIDAEIEEREPDQSRLTERYTERAVAFIDENQNRPFFLYLAHHYPQVPLHPAANVRGASAQGPYGDVIQEIDAMVGDLVAELEARELRSRTLIFFTSDNGPWLLYGDYAGSAGHLREGKGTTFEGGHRVPAIANWPGRIPPGSVSDKVATTMDLFPTAARLAGARLPDDRVIDGHDIMPILNGEADAETPYEALYFYSGGQLQAVRNGAWKLHIPHRFQAVEPGGGRFPGRVVERDVALSLFNLEEDPGESHNVASEHPEVVERLLAQIEIGRADLGDAATEIQGAGQNPPGEVAEPWEELLRESASESNSSR